MNNHGTPNKNCEEMEEDRGGGGDKLDPHK